MPVQIEPQVFKVEGRERRNVALIAEDLRDGRGVVDGSEGCIHDGVAFSHLEHGGVVLRGAQGDVLQGTDVRLIEIDQGSCRWPRQGQLKVAPPPKVANGVDRMELA